MRARKRLRRLLGILYIVVEEPGAGVDELGRVNDDRPGEAELRAETGSPLLLGEPGYTVLERRGARPTLDVNGLWGGFQGEGSKTIIPAHAHAKVSCRLVANQDPERIFEAVRAAVMDLAPAGIRVDVRNLHGGRPSLTPIDHPASRAAARALEATFGRAPVYLREGGSIPVTASFATILGLPTVLLGFSNPDDNAHAPNEKLDLGNFHAGVISSAILYDEISKVAK